MGLWPVWKELYSPCCSQTSSKFYTNKTKLASAPVAATTQPVLRRDAWFAGWCFCRINEIFANMNSDVSHEKNIICFTNLKVCLKEHKRYPLWDNLVQICEASLLWFLIWTWSNEAQMQTTSKTLLSYFAVSQLESRLHDRNHRHQTAVMTALMPKTFLNQ